ncbi:MAG: ATP-binding protein, partial [Beijerinckiaceae bacterium]
NGMLVMAELLAASDLSAKQRRYAEVIAASGGSLMSIINDILDFSKIEAGKIDLEAIPFDLAETVDNVCQLFASKADGKGLDLASFVAPDLGSVIGDPTRLGQVVGNLVNNAIKFTEKGHVLISARMTENAGQARLLVEISDTGIGIPEDKLATVFESFSQADQSTTRKFGGTGLGLSICQRLASAMGGEIGVRSKLGEGSTFWLSIPLMIDAGSPPRAARPASVEIGMGAPATSRALAEYFPSSTGGEGRKVWLVDERGHEYLSRIGLVSDPERPAIAIVSRIGQSRAERLLASGEADALLSWPLRRAEVFTVIEALAAGRRVEIQAKAAALSLPQFAGARVLVVDDSPVNREVALEALKRFGIAAETADGGVQALAMTGVARYDLVLMDGSMPDIDGFETARRIRAREAETMSARTPIVALTAHVVGEGAHAWKSAGMDGILPKPFRMEALAECLAGSLHGIAALATVVPMSAMPEAEPVAPDDLFNPDTLAQMAAMAQIAGADAARRIYGLFAEHAPPGLDLLRTAAASGVAEDIAKAAHALKSMSLSTGAAALASRLGDIENDAREGAPSPSEMALDGVQDLLDRTLDAIRHLPFLQDEAGQDVGEADFARRDQKTA